MVEIATRRDDEERLAELEELMADPSNPETCRRLARSHPGRLAEAMSQLEAAAQARALDCLDPRQQALVFGYLEPVVQVALARAIGRTRLARIVAAMSHDERADLFNRLPEAEQAALLPALAHAEREDMRRLASYPEGSAGAIMTSDYATLSPTLSVREAIEALRRVAPDRETIYDAYVIDEARHLLGVVSLRDLLLAEDRVRVSELMAPQVIAARVDDPREDVARAIASYDLLALPIVDPDERLVGIVTADDAMDVAEQEATEDFHRVGGVQLPAGHGTLGIGPVDVGRAGVWLLYRMRIVWLVILVFGNIFSGAAIAAFEDTIAAYVALVFFLPLLIDSGGNAGAQAATLMVRALATGEVLMRDWTRMIGREVLVAGLLGLSMAAAVSVVGVLRAGPDVALVVSLSMVLIVLIGSTIGMSLPFVLQKLKMDPAAASAPLITSIADAVGVVIYFTIATSLLPIPS